MENDRNGLEVLRRTESLRLLATLDVGRVVVSDRVLPAAVPVRFVLLDGDVVFVAGAGGELEAATADHVVAFEADEIDPGHQSGWTVLVQGRASVVTDAVERARAQALHLAPWAPTQAARFVRIRAEIVTGRRAVARAPQRRPLLRDCPACGSDKLLPVTDGSARNFVCTNCAACWRPGDDGLRRMRPDVCAGCSFERMCTAAHATDTVLTTAGDART